MNRILKNIVYHAPWLLSDRKFIESRWELATGGRLDLDHPLTFNEKVNWLKLHDRNPLYRTLVDKADVKDYIREKIGAEHVIPTIGVWDSFDDIDSDALPEDGFVLKCTHDSGSIVIVRDKSTFDRAAAKASLNRSLRHNYYWNAREWPYKDIRHRIIAEPYLVDVAGALRDYKFFCNNGKVKFLFVATDRFAAGSETRFDFFDASYNHLDLTNGHPMADSVPEKPEAFEQMVRICEALSEGIPFVRIDLYNLDGRILFGEYTFSHWGGFVPFDPPEWDRKLGDLIEL